MQPIEAASVCGIERASAVRSRASQQDAFWEGCLRLAAIVAVLCAIGRPRHSALAQQSVDLASVSGRVTDQSGAVVTDAQVTARQTQTNVTTTTTTDQEGGFGCPTLASACTKSRCVSPGIRTPCVSWPCRLALHSNCP